MRGFKHRIPIGGPTRWINPKSLYRRSRAEEEWKDEYEVGYAIDKERKEDKEGYGEGVR